MDRMKPISFLVKIESVYTTVCPSEIVKVTRHCVLISVLDFTAQLP